MMAARAMRMKKKAMAPLGTNFSDSMVERFNAKNINNCGRFSQG